MEFAITLNSNTSVPLHHQLYEELRQSILKGRLLPCQRLPSTRSLAQSLGISRTTVTQSYGQLLSEGYLETAVGSGTFVCAQLPEDLLHPTPVASAQRTPHSPCKLSEYGQALAQTDTSLLKEPEEPISFRYGRPAFDQFPIQLWRKLLSRHCRADRDWQDYSTDPLGYQPLRDAIARYLSQARAVKCDPEQILITNGTQQALYLILRLLIDPAETIALEDPGYLSARRIFLSQGANLLPIGVDSAGLIVQDLASVSPETIRLVYVTPSHQFPTGVTMSLSRRLALLAWAQQTGAMIIEDDYDSEYRYGGRPIPALQGLDQGESVLYIGTFSKVLFPSLRIGYLVLPPSLVSLFGRAKWLSDRHLPLLDQRVLTDFINEGHLERHIRKLRSHYDRCRQVLVQELQTQFGDRATVIGEKAGIHLMVRFHTSLKDAEIIQRVAQVGVGLVSAQPHYLQTYGGGEFILGYGELTQEQICEGVIRLSKILAPT